MYVNQLCNQPFFVGFLSVLRPLSTRELQYYVVSTYSTIIEREFADQLKFEVPVHLDISQQPHHRAQWVCTKRLNYRQCPLVDRYPCLDIQRTNSKVKATMAVVALP